MLSANARGSAQRNVLIENAALLPLLFERVLGFARVLPVTDSRGGVFAAESSVGVLLVGVNSREDGWWQRT